MNGLQKFKDTISKELYSMTLAEAHAKGLCIQCKKQPTYSSEAGRREYAISGLCEPCFDSITGTEEQI